MFLGIDACGCSDVTAVNCFIHNADDSFIAKAWTPQGAFTVSHSVVFSTVGSAFGANDEILDVASGGHFFNNTVIHSTHNVSIYGGILSVNTAMAGVIENFIFEDIVIEQASAGKDIIRVWIKDSAANAVIRNITFKNINVLNASEERIHLIAG